MVILEGASFSVAQNESKGKVHFEHSSLISEDTAQLFAEGSWTDRRQAEIVPVLNSVFAAKTRTNLWPMLPIGVRYVFFATGNKV